MREKRPPHAAGTRNFREVFRSLGRAPSKAAQNDDVEALREGAGRIVSCALRGSRSPYPRRFSHGLLQLTRGQAVWRPYWWSIKRQPINLVERVSRVEPR